MARFDATARNESIPPNVFAARLVRAPDGPVRVPLRAVALSVAVLALVVVDIRLGGPLDRLDHRLGTWIGAWGLRHRGVARWPLTIGVYFGQRGLVLTSAVVLAAGLAWRARTWEPVLRLVVATVSLAAVVYGFKLGLSRNAPIQDAHNVPAGHGASFPSGHLANAILLWGLADWSVRRWSAPLRLRRTVRIGRWIAPVAVFVAMMLLDYHWLSDFIAGAAVGVILLAIALAPGWTRAAVRVDARWLGARSPARRPDHR